jgi:hypothetical protein
MKRFDAKRDELLNEILGSIAKGAVNAASATASTANAFLKAAKDPASIVNTAQTYFDARDKAKKERVGSQNNPPQKNTYVYLQENPKVTAKIIDTYNKKDFKIRLSKLIRNGNKISEGDSEFVFVKMDTTQGDVEISKPTKTPQATPKGEWQLKLTQNVNKTNGKVLDKNGKLEGTAIKENGIFQISFDLNVTENSTFPNWIRYDQLSKNTNTQQTSEVEGDNFTTRRAKSDKEKPKKDKSLPKNKELLTVGTNTYIFKATPKGNGQGNWYQYDTTTQKSADRPLRDQNQIMKIWKNSDPNKPQPPQQQPPQQQPPQQQQQQQQQPTKPTGKVVYKVDSKNYPNRQYRLYGSDWYKVEKVKGKNTYIPVKNKKNIATLNARYNKQNQTPLNDSFSFLEYINSKYDLI